MFAVSIGDNLVVGSGWVTYIDGDCNFQFMSMDYGSLDWIA